MTCLSDTVYPFTALVGQERMKRALLLNAINPKIGGVLIRGEKGTAKSTAARALADLLPQAEICISMAVQGHRADIVIVRTAAIAAFEGRMEVMEEDIREAAELALPHHMRRKPFEEQKLDQDKLNETIEKHQEQEEEYQGDSSSLWGSVYKAG